MTRPFSDIVRGSGISPTNANLHRIGHDMQAIVDSNIDDAIAAGADPDECWACYSRRYGRATGSIALIPARGPEYAIEITCPICEGEWQ